MLQVIEPKKLELVSNLARTGRYFAQTKVKYYSNFNTSTFKFPHTPRCLPLDEGMIFMPHLQSMSPKPHINFDEIGLYFPDGLF